MQSCYLQLDAIIHMKQVQLSANVCIMCRDRVTHYRNASDAWNMCRAVRQTPALMLASRDKGLWLTCMEVKYIKTELERQCSSVVATCDIYYSLHVFLSNSWPFLIRCKFETMNPKMNLAGLLQLGITKQRIDMHTLNGIRSCCPSFRTVR
jgi:hypothetical protein